MALRDQPYLKLFIKDFMTDEKLAQCSAESTGVYIRIMCLMHKNEEYGTVLLRQKFQQNSSACLNFAEQLDCQLPYKVDVIERSLEELVEIGVLTITDNKMSQKRMVKDFALSNVRSEAGSIGGFATAKCIANMSAKGTANTAYEYEDVIQDKNESEERKERLPYKEIVDYLNSKIGSNYGYATKATKAAIHARFAEKFTLENFYTVINVKVAEWMGDEKMQKNLNPDCLFGTKFEKYLNQPTTQSTGPKKNASGGYDK